MDFKKHFLAFALIFSSVSFSQDMDSIPSYVLNEIVISANKTRTSELFVANSVSIIDSSEISRKERISLLDLLKSEYGLTYTTQGNAGSNSFVTLRGSGAGHTLVLIDGIEMNRSTDPGNTFDFSTVTTENIERIEILRGPQSTLYGSDALAGVINIFTKKGSQGLKLSLSSEGGSYNTYKGNAALSGSKGILYFNINYGHTSSSGFSSAAEKYGNTEKDGFRNTTISTRAGLNINPDLQLDLRYHFTKAFADLDWAGGTSGDHDSYISNTEETGFRGSVFHKAFDIWENTAGFSYRRNFRKYSYGYQPVSLGPSDSRYDGNRIKVDWQSNLYLPDNIITAGAEYEKENMSSDYNEYFFNSFSVMPLVSNSTAGIFLQDQFRLKSLFLNAGIRYDKNEIFGSHYTYRISPAYLFAETGTKLKASYGTGFKSPSLTNLLDPMYGNKELKPETSAGWDAGLEQYFADFTAGINYFSLNFDDLFVFDPSVYKTRNLQKASSKGVEIYMYGDLFRNIRIKSSYTFNEVKEISNNSAINMVRKPKHKAAINLDYTFFENAYAGTEIIYTGKRKDLFFSPETFLTEMKELQDFIIVNLTLSYNIFDNLKVYTRFDNLFNKDYEEIYGFATPRFSVYAGVKFDTGDFLKL